MHASVLLFLSVRNGFFARQRRFSLNGKANIHIIFSSNMDKLRAIVFGASNLSRNINKSSQYKQLQILPKVAVDKNTFLDMTPILHLTFCCLKHSRDQAVKSSSFSPICFTIRSQHHQVSYYSFSREVNTFFILLQLFLVFRTLSSKIRYESSMRMCFDCLKQFTFAAPGFEIVYSDFPIR